MPEKFNFIDYKGRRYVKGEDPEQCPFCNKNIVPKEEYWLTSGKRNGDNFGVDILFRCPNVKCQRVFVGRYLFSNAFTDDRIYQLKIDSVFPVQVDIEDFSDIVSEISPSFIQIYNQAFKAEAHDLFEISGIGYRKALEFLVKDYCVKNEPEKEEKIKREFLSQTINNRINNENIKTCAERAAWLGNDEAHYERRWVEKDISDLKTLIHLTVNWIEHEALTQEYQDSMNKD